MNEYINEEYKMEMMCDFCDECSEFIGTYEECIKESKQEGWKIYKQKEDWIHKCPLCVYNDSNPKGVF